MIHLGEDDCGGTDLTAFKNPLGNAHVPIISGFSIDFEGCLASLHHPPPTWVIFNH